MTDEVFQMEKAHPERYGQRVTDVTVVETGQKLDVKTYIVVPPTICKTLCLLVKYQATNTQQTEKALAHLQP
jgi:hypothetical protein